VHFKKSRLGIENIILCDPSILQRVLAMWMEESTTLGCRVERIRRVVFDRVSKTFHVDLESGNKNFSGDVTAKFIMFKQGIAKDLVPSRPMFKVEYDDLKKIAENLEISLHAARRLVETKMRESRELVES